MVRNMVAGYLLSVPTCTACLRAGRGYTVNRERVATVLRHIVDIAENETLPANCLYDVAEQCAKDYDGLWCVVYCTVAKLLTTEDSDE